MSNAPGWISSLTTASIASDVKAADVNGVVSEAGLTKLLTDLGSTLSSSSTLTAQELTDLKTIAANLNNGISSSNYLTYIFNALVNGNSANKTWTGGAASSITVGNLVAGFTAAQFSDLVGKWFLGTDLPSSLVSLSGSPNFSVSYSLVNSPLFGSSGPSMNDVNQGYLGDCYFLSSCAEVALQNPTDITSMFTNNGNGTYGVRFYVNGKAEYVTINLDLADGGEVFNSASNIWASLAEKAYTQLQTTNLYTGNSVNFGNSYNTIGNGGDPAYTLEALTGATSITEYYASGSTWESYGFNSSLAYTGSSSSESTASLLSSIVADLAARDDVILSSNTDATDSSGRITLVSDHAMSIYGYDSSTGELEIRNPWGSMAGQNWDTTFEIGLSTLLSDGDTITADNASTASASTGEAISASAAYVAANIDALNGNAQVTSITLTDSGAPVLSILATQAANDTRVLNEITNGLFEVLAPGVEPTFHVSGAAADGWGLVSSSNSTIDVASTQASVVGAGDTIDYSGANDVVSLYSTGGNWDTVNGSNGAIIENSVQASVIGSGDTIDYNGSGNVVSLYSTDGNWDLVNASNGTIIENSIQASVIGGGDTVDYNGWNDVVSLYSTPGNWDLVNGSNGTIIVNSAQTSVIGGGDTIDFNGSNDFVSLYSTIGNWDLVNSSNGTVIVNSAQISVIGGGDTIDFNGSGDAASLYTNGAAADVVNGSSAVLVLTNSAASIIGAGDTISFAGSDTATVSGSGDLFAFGASLGHTTINGFNGSDSIQLSHSDFASFQALQQHMSQSGANTLVALDASDQITLTNVTASSLTASQFRFA